MKKLFSTLGGLIFVALVVLAICLFFAWSRIPDIVANRLSDKMKVAVEIEDIRFTKTSIGLEQLEIGNPAGYTLPKAFSSESIQVNAPLTNYLDDRIIIDQVAINRVYLGLEFDAPGSTRGNWSKIMKNLKESAPPAPTEGNKKSGKGVLIKQLVLTDINVDLAYTEGGLPIKQLKPIPKITFTNVSSEGGIPTAQIAQLILEQSLRAIFDVENLQNMVEGFLESPAKGIENALSPLKDILP